MKHGKGFPQNYVMAHMFWNIAVVNGYKYGISSTRDVEILMTASQIEKAEDLAREWMRTHQ